LPGGEHREKGRGSRGERTPLTPPPVEKAVTKALSSVEVHAGTQMLNFDVVDMGEKKE
jgi:hypothetical protein